MADMRLAVVGAAGRMGRMLIKAIGGGWNVTNLPSLNALR